MGAITAKSFSRRDVKNIAVEYASSPAEISGSYFQKTYGFSEAVFYGILKRAVVESIVDDKVVESIKEKSIHNSQEKGGIGGGIRSLYKYQRLIEERKKFEFTIKEKKKLVTEYANAPKYVDLRMFCLANCIGQELFSRTIKSAILNNIVSDEIVDMLEEKALQHNDADEVKKVYFILRAERKSNIDAMRERKREQRSRRAIKKRKPIITKAYVNLSKLNLESVAETKTEAEADVKSESVAETKIEAEEKPELVDES